MSDDIKMVYNDDPDLDLSFCDLYIREDVFHEDGQLNHFLQMSFREDFHLGKGFVLLPLQYQDIKDPDLFKEKDFSLDFKNIMPEADLDHIDLQILSSAGLHSDTALIVSYDPSDYKEDQLYRLYWPILDLAVKKGKTNIMVDIFGSSRGTNDHYIDTFAHLNSYPELDKVNIYILRDRILDDFYSEDPKEYLENLKKEDLIFPDKEAAEGRSYAEELKEAFRSNREKEEVLEKYPDFPSYLFYLINKRIKEDENKDIPKNEKIIKYSNVYNNVLMDRRLFSKLQRKDYHPGKKTVIQLILGAKLNMEDATELLRKAGYVFDPQEDLDYLVMSFIENRIYDIAKINSILAAHHLDQL